MARFYHILLVCTLFLNRFSTVHGTWQDLTGYHLAVNRLAIAYPTFFELASTYASEVSDEVGLPVRIYSASVSIQQSEFAFLFPKIPIRDLLNGRPIPIEIARNVTRTLNYAPNVTWEDWMDYLSVTICPTQDPWDNCGDFISVNLEVNTTSCGTNDSLCPEYHEAHCTFSKHAVEAAQKVFRVLPPLPSHCFRNYPIGLIICLIVIVVITISLIMFFVLKNICCATPATQATQDIGITNPSFEKEETTSV